MNRPGVLLGVIVLLALTALASASDHQRPGAEQTSQGQITALQPDQNQFTLKTSNGQALLLNVDIATRIKVNGRSSALTDFHKGNRVRVYYYDVGGGKNRVLWMSALPGRTTAVDLPREINQLLNTVKDYTIQQKEQYLEKLRATLVQVDQQIDQLQERALKAGTGLQKETRAALQELQQRRQVVSQRLTRVQDASPAAWVEVVRSIGVALRDLEQAYQRAAEQFR